VLFVFGSPLLGEAMVGINVDEIAQPHRLAERGW
jgi:pyridoxal 5'-phosphate synthase pdxS subunit